MVWPIFILINIVTALKGTHFYFVFAITAAGVVPRGGPRKSARTPSIVQIIFSFRPFEIRVGIWGNQKLLKGLDSFSKPFKNVGLNSVYFSLCVDCLAKMFKITVFFLWLFAGF